MRLSRRIPRAPRPRSPVDCAGCDEEVELQLVPYGGTNIRIGVFPWFH